MNRTPLYSWHKAHAKSMVNFNGFDMPLAYTGIEAEHAHVRTHAGIFDVSHMGQIKVHGEEARKRLDYLFTNTLPKPGRVKYGMMLKEDGGILDDMLVYGLYDTGFMLVPNAGNTKKIYQHCVDYIGHESVKNVSSDYGLIALQGPMASEIMHTYAEFKPLKRFQFIYSDYDDDTMIISRTGYTGEDGYELYVPSYRLTDLWHDLLETTGVKPIGLGARDTLRFEACLPLYGHEIAEYIKPTEAGLEFALDQTKKYRGKKVLEQDPGEFKLMGIELLDRGIARERDLIMDVDPPEFPNEKSYPWAHLFAEPDIRDEALVGFVTTGYKLKSQGKSLAMAMINPKKLNENARVIIRDKDKQFKTADLPFIKR